MTCDERLEKMLNRAGQTISDLPKPMGKEWAYNKTEGALSEAAKWCGFDINDYPEGSVYAPTFIVQYIRHLTDIIDRMEAALENVIGQRNYLLKVYGYDCKECVKHEDSCNLTDREFYMCDSDLVNDWAGVPDGWEVKNDAE